MFENIGQIGANGAGWGAACPQNGVSCFRKKGFGVFGGCNGARDVPKTGFLISGKKVLAFRGHGAKLRMSLFGQFLFVKKTLLSSTTFFQLSEFGMMYVASLNSSAMG